MSARIAAREHVSLAASSLVAPSFAARLVVAWLLALLAWSFVALSLVAPSPEAWTFGASRSPAASSSASYVQPRARPAHESCEP